MDRLTLFGLFAVTAMLFAMRWRIAAGGLSSASPGRALLDRPTDFSKALGRSESSRLSGVSSRCGVGGQEAMPQLTP